MANMYSDETDYFNSCVRLTEKRRNEHKSDENTLLQIPRSRKPVYS